MINIFLLIIASFILYTIDYMTAVRVWKKDPYLFRYFEINKNIVFVFFSHFLGSGC